MAKIRLDQLMVERGLAESRSRAQALIAAGDVRVNGQVQTRPAVPVADDTLVEVAEPLPYVSRGGYKLAHALDVFGLRPDGLDALDAGASTGGFTDVLLQRGARRVFAVDVGYGILHWKLRSDPRVTVLERTNIRNLQSLPPDAEGAVPPLAGCATADLAFISLTIVLPAIRRLVLPEAWIVALIKPQFEAGAEQVGKGGVVRDPKVHQAVLRHTLAFAATIGLPAQGLTRSPLTGPAGNIEFLAWLHPRGTLDTERAIADVLK
jgi:23S rRNA (cytidine1920-2'-O)/16S rRNA (cytidine1409-2'-O)-methyltransferase